METKVKNKNKSTKPKHGKNCIISHTSIFCGKNIIGNDVEICDYCEITNCLIGNGSIIKFSILENSTIGDDCKIGPFARLREKNIINSRCKIGNFVELKNCIIGENTKISHLAYIGDAEIGQNCNIGCGVVFANYNGKTKQKIILEDGCFVGCNCTLIAPIVLGKGCYICAGTVVTHDVPQNAMVIGRAQPTIKANRAKKYWTGGDA
ncbi:MAG: DapH/DapD/GlmU-related protein [Clostridia bacterium]